MNPKVTYTTGQIIEYRKVGSKRSGRITLDRDASVKDSGYIKLVGYRTRKDGIMLGTGGNRCFVAYVRLDRTTVYATHAELAAKRA